jgi:hypothetical protein
VTSSDWVITFTFDADPVMDQMDFWESQLENIDASVAHIPGRGVDVTVYATGDMPMIEAIEKMASSITNVVHAQPIAAEIVNEVEWQRRAEAPTMPELMSAAEIADELGVSRQRVHQLRETAAFPAPLADLRGGAVWDANAVRKFNELWERRPGRPPRQVVTLEGIPSAEAFGELTVTMGRPHRREVTPNPDGGWDVKMPGADRTSAHLDTQAKAIDRARQILRNIGGGELRVRGRDGRIRTFDATVRAKDPHPPES